MTRFPVLIEDDFELYGNGLGDVASLQYLPTMAFLNVLDSIGAKVSFMVDVAQQLFLRSRRSEDRHVAMQCELWEHTVRCMQERGHDVQLHLHPQWLGATRRDDYNFLGKRWNIGQYEPLQQRTLISEAIAYLKSLLGDVNAEYSVVAYKAGSWGMQPSRQLMETLQSQGVRIVLGAREGMCIPSNGVDFRGMEEPNLPYSPNFDDLRKVADRPNGMVLIPMQAYAPDWLALASLTAARIRSKLARTHAEERYYHPGSVPREILALSPLEGRRQLRFAYRPYLTHLKIGDVPHSYLRRSFRNVVERLRKLDRPCAPIVIESHTKQFKGQYRDISRFLADVQRDYAGEADFVTLSQLATEFDRHPEYVRSRYLTT